VARPGDGRSPRHGLGLPPLTVGDYLDALAARGLDGSAAGPPGARVEYAELALDVERVACGLLALGVAKGDAIAIWAPPSPRWRLVQLASARIGAVLVTMDGDWDAGALARVLTAERPRLVVTSGAARIAALQALRGGAGPAARLVVLDGPPPESGALAWGELLVAGTAIDLSRLRARSAALAADDCVALEYVAGAARPRPLTHGDYLGLSAHVTREEHVVPPISQSSDGT
jgi:fatty-acyl-CoA synthase